jgi:hypothetical protein
MGTTKNCDNAAFVDAIIQMPRFSAQHQTIILTKKFAKQNCRWQKTDDFTIYTVQALSVQVVVFIVVRAKVRDLSGLFGCRWKVPSRSNAAELSGAQNIITNMDWSNFGHCHDSATHFRVGVCAIRNY